MPDLAEKVSKPRRPQKTAPFKIIKEYYNEFKNIYEEKYQPK